MVEPAQKDRVRVEQRFHSEIRGAGAIAPWNMRPRSGNQILALARKRTPSVRAQSQEAFDTALRKQIKPAWNMQRGNQNAIEPLRHIEFRPIFARLIVIEPIQHILRQAIAVKRRMIANRQHAGLRSEIRPGLFEPVAGFPQPFAPGVRFQQL
jgi:hypothetical protein